ncbi:hypothetical protein Misp01_20570 [Microtetraspora sp. NBRC 13810]|uniref:monodechloroaminopyrrolnitrin synthase PrnB family protein n=1 Tax=Microtetraspora sp. NBRC 13810 TaxID=3030990 RepID=UPI0024A5F326|nr:monodechloroaminopyrrolnitrin synthase PrnB family protein [Microtetraspora sp. NBRC 13810]GLW06927.1 hypothetical protein Misp01_20570 [Microtetraspora sp. NBRC 13810]
MNESDSRPDEDFARAHGFDGDHVAGLDPLRMDGLLPALRTMNAAADLRGLTGMLHARVLALPEPAAFSVAECLAAMRDLGLLAGSVKRHGAEPVDAVPGLEAVLLELGRRTRMVPRDTVHHYVRWNPAGARARMYTGDRMETMLISSVRISLPRLSAAVRVCRRLAALEPHDLRFVVAANELVSLLGSLEDSLDTVIATVSPEFFARTLRPYFEDMRVGGARYLGPAAAHVPLGLVDLVLWAGDHADAGYEELWRESARYGLPGWRALSEEWAAGPSLVTRLGSALAAGETSPNIRAGAEALSRALHSLVAFRGKHLTIARKAYAEEIRLYPLGSGGGSVALLDQVMRLTRANAGLVRRSFKTGRRPLTPGDDATGEVRACRGS